MSLIELKKITKVYNTGVVKCIALQDVSFKIDKGEFVAIMGPSGSGKSTLMNVLGFLDVPTKGSYLFEDKIMKAYDEDSLAEIRNKKIGFVFQSFYLLARMTALENVKLPLIYANLKESEQEKIAMRNLKAVGLEKRMYHNPNELSGGQQQRVAIARALGNDPQIILADEPTGNIDTKSSTEIMAVLKKLNKSGRTIIIVTHNKSVAAYAKKVIRIEDGKILSIKTNKRQK